VPEINILKIWWPEIISNQELRTQTEEDPIEIQIRRRKFRWLGHTLRKKEMSKKRSKRTPKEEKTSSAKRVIDKKSTIGGDQSNGIYPQGKTEMEAIRNYSMSQEGIMGFTTTTTIASFKMIVDKYGNNVRKFMWQLCGRVKLTFV
jgi:hypothetical protein